LHDLQRSSLCMAKLGSSDRRAYPYQSRSRHRPRDGVDGIQNLPGTGERRGAGGIVWSALDYQRPRTPYAVLGEGARRLRQLQLAQVLCFRW